MRKLASIRKISDLLPIDGADLIVTAIIDGWTVVVKKNEFKVGDLCVYFEIDSFLPDGNPAWQHLVDKHPRNFESQRGHKLKTVKLRKQLSQGFVIPVSHELEVEWSHTFLNFEDARPLQVGDDVTEILNIKKWEATIPAELAGQVNGNFPTFIKKTDQERCQNIGNEIFIDNADAEYEITMKLDGTSFTAYYMNREVVCGTEPAVGGQMAWAELKTAAGVCSRNWELKSDISNDSNSLVRMYIDSNLRDALRNLGLNYAVQGELMGPGIQGNRELLSSHKLYIFDIYDIDNGCYLAPADRRKALEQLYQSGLDSNMVKHVPVIHERISLSELGITDVKGLLAYAEGPSLTHEVKEGDVYKRVDGGFSFKAISNTFLLKEKD